MSMQATTRPPKGLRLLLTAWFVFLGWVDVVLVSRAGEYLGYSELGTVLAFSTGALVIGIAVAPLVPLAVKPSLVLAGLLTVVSIVGIAATLVGLPKAMIYVVVLSVWCLTSFASGIIDNASGALAIRVSTGGRADAVLLLGIRRTGALIASVFTTYAVSQHLSPAWHYTVVGVLLLIPVLMTAVMPDVATQSTAAQSRTTGVGSTAKQFWILVLMGAFLAAAVMPTLLSLAWASPLMKELHASDSFATYGTLVFLASQVVACFAYYARSGKRKMHELVPAGLWVSVVGVVLLAATVLQVHLQFMSPAAGQWLALAGIAVFGWGIAPVPFAILIYVGELQLRWNNRVRTAVAVVIQCGLMAFGNWAFGLAAEAFSAIDAYPVVALLCIVALLIGMQPMFRKPRTGQA